MRRWLGGVTIPAVLMAAVAGTPAAAAAQTQYVGLRAAVEGVGGTVRWVQESQTVEIEINGVPGSVKVGSTEFKLGGEKARLPAAVELRSDNRTYVPSELTDLLRRTGELTKLQLPAGYSYNVLMRDGDPLKDGKKFGAMNDLTVYVPIKGADEGYLFVNHETRPGGATVLTLKRNAGGAYDVTDSRAVDFSGVGGTWNNCAGTATPWGTVLTTEEYPATTAKELEAVGLGSDLNNFGWMVEVNPATLEVKKLFALGRFSHEGATVLPDKKTVVMGDDFRGGAIFKFVADREGDLTSGKLYALNMEKREWILIPGDRATLNDARKYALEHGATPFDRPEETEYNPVDGMVYIAETGDNKQSGDRQYGRIWKLNPQTNEMTVFIQGGPQTGVIQPDNLQIDKDGNIYILEDRYENFMAPTLGYGNNQIWKATRDGKVTLFGTMPLGSEGTGMSFTPDFKTMFFAVQHPSAPWKHTVVQVKLP